MLNQIEPSDIRHQPTTETDEPACEICGGSLYVIEYSESRTHSRAVPCICAAAAEARERWAGRIKACFNSIMTATPARYAGASMDQVALPETSPVLKAARAFVACAKPGSDPSAFVLHGPVGVGKSYLAYSMVRDLKKRDLVCLTLSVTDLIETLRSNQFGEENMNRISLLQEVPVLMLDDLAAHRNTPFALERLFLIIDSRYRSMKPTIVTSNKSFRATLQGLSGDPDAWTDWQRIASRLREMAGDYVFEYSGPDRRVKG